MTVDDLYEKLKFYRQSGAGQLEVMVYSDRRGGAFVTPAKVEIEELAPYMKPFMSSRGLTQAYRSREFSDLAPDDPSTYAVVLEEP